MIIKLLASIGAILIIFGVYSSHVGAGKTSVFYPTQSEVKKCIKFCKAPAFILDDSVGGRLKFERTFNGVTWACECSF